MSNDESSETNQSEAHGRVGDDVRYTVQSDGLKMEVYTIGKLPMPRVRLVDLHVSPPRRLFDFDAFRIFPNLVEVVTNVNEYLIALLEGRTEEG